MPAGRLSLTVTDGYFIADAPEEATEGHAFYQVALRVGNLTAEELNVTLDYSHMIYSRAYNHLARQIFLPFADNEMWVETLAANESKEFVMTFEVKADSDVNCLFVQDFFEENEPVLFNLP